MDNLQKKALLHALKGLLLPTITVCLIVLIATLNIQVVFNILLDINFWWLRITLVIVEILLFAFLYDKKLLQLQQIQKEKAKEEYEQSIESNFKYIKEEEIIIKHYELFTERDLEGVGYMPPRNTSYIGGKVYVNDDYILIKMSQNRKIEKI